MTSAIAIQICMRELQYDTKYNLGSECLAEYKYKKSSISSDLEVKLKADDALVWGLNWLLHPQIGIFLYKNLYFYHLVEGIFAIKYKYKQKFKNRCLRLKYSYIKIKKEKKKKKKKKRRKKDALVWRSKWLLHPQIGSALLLRSPFHCGAFYLLMIKCK